MKIFKLFILAFLVISIVSCEGEKMTNEKNIDVNKYKIESTVLNSLAEKKIYFAHQSVGGNILDGIETIIGTEKPAKIIIQKRAGTQQFSGPKILHEFVGANGDPLLKIQEFRNSLMSGMGNEADIAVMKFCYLDINKTTDIDEVFNEYKKTVSEIESAYPDLKIVHMTVPLTLKEPTVKGFIKNLIGRPDNNIMRARYNEKLLQEYTGKQQVFDLAAIESTREDGSQTEQKDGQQTFYSLAPEYAADNGHLNRLGQLKAGEQFAEFLARNLAN